MIKEDSLIGVVSRTFTKTSELRGLLEKRFTNIKYNENLQHFNQVNLIEFLKGCEGIIVAEDKISRRVIDELPNLKVVSKFGVGLDSINTDYLHEKKIHLSCKSGINASSVAELALCYIVLMLREAYCLNRSLINGSWFKVENSRELSESTIGIIGFGNIGKKLASFLQPYQTQILVYDSLLDPGKDLEEYVKAVSLKYLLKNSDAISLHVPLSDETLGFIGEPELRLMKDQAVLVNLSRGGVVCESALYKALKENHLAGAAFDVFEYEPENSSEFNSDLIELKNFFCTPHIAGTSKNTIKELGLSAIDGLIECLEK